MNAKTAFLTAVRQCTKLPEEVRGASFTYIKERVVSHTLLRQLETQTPGALSVQNWSARIERRRKALTPYCDRKLVCGYVRLPGVYYTIEVDPQTTQIVHWEWSDAP